MFEYPFGVPARRKRATAQWQENAREANTLAYIRYAFAQGGGFLSYHLHSVARLVGQEGEADKIVGIAAFYTGRQLWRLSLSEILSIARFFGVIRAPGIAKRALQVGEIVSSPQVNEGYIANFAVAPAFRRMGIGRALTVFLLEQARKQERDSLLLDVVTNNKAAFSLYEGLGFTRWGKAKSCAERNASLPSTQALHLLIQQ